MLMSSSTVQLSREVTKRVARRIVEPKLGIVPRLLLVITGRVWEVSHCNTATVLRQRVRNIDWNR